MTTVKLSPSLKPAKEIPSTVLESWKSWWRRSTSSGAASEERLLRRMPYYQSPSEFISDPSSKSLAYNVIARSSQVPLSNHQNQYLNTLSLLPTIIKSTHSATPPAVILHGYGAGLGFFYRNFPALASWVATRGTPIYAIDWLGMGRSSRPPFHIRAKRNDTLARVTETENFFIDALDEWRQKMGFDKFTLVGHSLGGYLSVAYTLRYPNHVERLILLSPAGVPADPDAEMPSHEIDAPSSTSLNSSSSPEVHPASQKTVETMHAKQTVRKKQESRSRRLFTYLWEEGWSPFQVVRSSLFFAPMIVGKYSSRRFAGATDEEARDIHDYILHITLAKGSGEYSISHLLAPGAMARLPLVNRVSPIKAPVTFVYGSHDWMDPEGGYKAVENLKAAGNRNSRIVIIPNAGHHVYFDNPKAVNDLLCKELDKTIR